MTVQKPINNIPPKYKKLLEYYNIKGETKEEVIPFIVNKLESINLGFDLINESFEILITLLHNITNKPGNENNISNKSAINKTYIEKDEHAIKTKEKTSKQRTSKRNITKINPHSNEEDRTYFNDLAKVFPPDEYKWHWMVRSGVSIKYKYAKMQRNIFSIEYCSVFNGEINNCNLCLDSLSKREHLQMLHKEGYNYVLNVNGTPVFKKLTLKQVIDIVAYFKDFVINNLMQTNKKLAVSRYAMEKHLQNATTHKREEWLNKLDRAGLETYIRDNNLNIKVRETWNDNKIRKEIKSKINQ